MITELLIKNFQAHKRLKIKLHPGVTTIVGPTDRGKSAVIRALQLLALNRPAGTAYIREGEEGTIVRAVVDDHIVARRRTKSVNAYEVDGVPLLAFKSDPPPDVQRILNLTALNFQGQHDAPFWFANTAGEVSRELNRIINLGLIDQVLNRLAVQFRDANAEVRVSESRLRTAKETRRGMSPILEVNEALLRLEQQQANIEAGLHQRAELDRLVARVVSYQGEATRANLVHERGKVVLQAGMDWRQLVQTANQIRHLVRTAQLQQQLAAVEIPDLSRLQRLLERKKQAEQQRDQLKKLITTLHQQQEIIETTRHKLQNHQAEIQRSNRCPTCGQILPKV